MGLQLSAVAVEVNDEPVAIEPGTLSFDEGFGEALVRAASTGGEGTELIFGRDVSSALSMIKFEIASTIPNVEKSRAWQAGLGANTVQISASFGGKSFSRTMTQGSVVNNPEVNVGPEGTIEVEFKGNPVV